MRARLILGWPSVLQYGSASWLASAADPELSEIPF